MDFDLSEEQRLLKESVDGLLNDSYDFDARKKYAAEKGGWSRGGWSKLAEQGPPWRLGRTEGRAHSRHHRRQQDLCLRAARKEFALRSRRRLGHGQEKG